MGRSAEFCRGCLHAIDDLPGMPEHLRLEWINRRIEIYTAELAAAEAREATQPTATEVIAACRVALEYLEVAPFEHCIEHDHEGCRGCASKSATSALALIARYKEADHAK